MAKENRLIIDGVEQCASDDKEEFMKMGFLRLCDLEQEIEFLSEPVPEWIKDAINRHGF